MLNALFIPLPELAELVRNYLEANGHYVTDGTGITISADGVTVLNAPKKDDVTVGEASGGTHYVVSDHGSDVGSSDEAERAHDQVAALLTEKPMTTTELAEAVGVEAHVIMDVMGNLDVFKAAPAREDGETVPKWMIDGTPEADAFRTMEAARINTRLDEMRSAIMDVMPKFHQERANRPELVEKMAALAAHEDQAEAIRRDSRAVFYRMAELGELEHKSNSWRAGKTDSDRINVASLQGAIRETLVMSPDGLSKDEVLNKLPAPVPGSLLRHALRRMDDVYEQAGLLKHAG